MKNLFLTLLFLLCIPTLVVGQSKAIRNLEKLRFDGTNQLKIVSTAPAAGLLNSNSPTTAVALFTLFDGALESQIAATNLGASKSITITGTGTITKICLISSLGTPIAENGSVFFFNADPAITVDTDDLTIAEAGMLEAVISFSGGEYLSNFATTVFNCQEISEAFDLITHVVYHQEGITTFDDENMKMLLWYRRDS